MLPAVRTWTRLFTPTQLRALCVLSVGLVLLATASGCRSGGLLKAQEIPPEFLVPKNDNVQTIDLSRMAGFSAANDMIDRGDVLEVTIESGYSNDKANVAPVRIGEDGMANVPIVGKVPLLGLPLESAEEAITAAAVQRGIFRNPTVTVAMRKQRSNKITVVGAVDKAGVYELPRKSSGLVAALVAAGGLTKNAGADIEIRKASSSLAANQGPGVGGQTLPGGVQQVGFQANAEPGKASEAVSSSVRVNLVEAARNGNSYYLDDGDVVMVSKRDPQPLHVLGLVNKPGEFELPTNKDIHVLDAIALAGGASTAWADRVHLIRTIPGSDAPIVVDISMREAKREGVGNLRLGPGDVVSVEQTTTTIITSALRAIGPYSITAIVPFIK